MRVLHLATDLGPTANARRLSCLAPLLAEEGIEQAAIVLDYRAFFTLAIPTTPISLRRWLDIGGWLKLRRAIGDFRPEIIHCWGRRTAEVLAAIRPGCRVLKTFEGSETIFSRRVGTRLDLPPIAPDFAMGSRLEARRGLGLRDGDRVVLACDRFETLDARLAVWAIDLLKYTSPDWRLVIAGDGPTRGRIERYECHLAADDSRTTFAGIRDIATLIPAADFVWQVRRRGGAHFILEALAAGLPVIGIANPSLPFLDAENSIPAPDAMNIASRTNELFGDGGRRAALAEAGRATAARFTIRAALEAVLQAYRG